MSAFRLALLDLIRRPLSSVIALISISLSVATAGTLLRLGNLAEKRYSSLANSGDAIVGAKSGDLDILLGSSNAEFDSAKPPGYLPLKLFESLKAAQPVKFEDGHEAQPGFIKSISPFVYAGTLEGAAAVAADESLLQRPLRIREGTWATAPAELVVGSALAEKKNYKVGQVVSVDPLVPASSSVTPVSSPELLGRPLPFKIVGILYATHSAWDRQAWMSLSSAHVLLTHTRLHNSIWGVDVLNYFLVELQPSNISPNVSESFEKLQALVNDRTVGQVISVPEAKDKLQKLTGTSRDLGLLIVGLVLLMAILSLASVLITRFDSLALQFAVLRAIGYSKRELASWLLCEGLLLGAAACFLGALIDGAAFPAVRLILGNSLPPPDLVTSSIFESYPIWIGAVIATLLSVVVPIIRSYRQDVHTSLRS